MPCNIFLWGWYFEAYMFPQISTKSNSPPPPEFETRTKKIKQEWIINSILDWHESHARGRGGEHSGRYFVALSLAEAETIRRIMHLRADQPTSRAGAWGRVGVGRGDYLCGGGGGGRNAVSVCPMWVGRKARNPPPLCRAALGGPDATCHVHSGFERSVRSS